MYFTHIDKLKTGKETTHSGVAAQSSEQAIRQAYPTITMENFKSFRCVTWLREEKRC